MPTQDGEPLVTERVRTFTVIHSDASPSRYVWTLAEINQLPEFGQGMGWFYGLVRNHETGRVGLYEILPGLGYCTPWPLWNPKSWWWVIGDIRATSKRKPGRTP